MIGFENFADDVIQQNTNRGVSMRPTPDMGVIKQDGRDGSIKILLPSGDNDERREAHVKSLEFVVITRVQHLKANDVISNPSYRSVFDLYETTPDQTRSMGLMTWQDTRDATDPVFEGNNYARTNDRLIGILRKVDGKAPKENADIAAAFGDNPVPVFFDVFGKKQEALKAAYPGGRYTGVAIDLKADKSKNTAYSVSYNGRNATYYKPAITATKVGKATLGKMAEYAQGFMGEVSDWVGQVKKNDKFLNDLYMAGFREANTVEKLRTYDVNWDTWEDKLGEWQKAGRDYRQEVARMLIGGSPVATPAPAPAGSAQPVPSDTPAEATPAGPTGDTEITDEDLPF